MDVPLLSTSTDYTNINSAINPEKLKYLINNNKAAEQALTLNASGRYPVTKNVGLGGSLSTDFTSRGDADATIFADTKVNDALWLKAMRQFNRNKNAPNSIADTFSAKAGLGDLSIDAARRINRGVNGGKDVTTDSVKANYMIKPPISAFAEYSKEPNNRHKGLGLMYDAAGFNAMIKAYKNKNINNDGTNYAVSFNKKF